MDYTAYVEQKEHVIYSPFNFGAETSGYLQFIVEYYDCLPLRFEIQF